MLEGKKRDLFILKYINFGVIQQFDVVFSSLAVDLILFEKLPYKYMIYTDTFIYSYQFFHILCYYNLELKCICLGLVCSQ